MKELKERLCIKYLSIPECFKESFELFFNIIRQEKRSIFKLSLLFLLTTIFELYEVYFSSNVRGNWFMTAYLIMVVEYNFLFIFLRKCIYKIEEKGKIKIFDTILKATFLFLFFIFPFLVVINFYYKIGISLFIIIQGIFIYVIPLYASENIDLKTVFRKSLIIGKKNRVRLIFPLLTVSFIILTTVLMTIVTLILGFFIYVNVTNSNPEILFFIIEVGIIPLIFMVTIFRMLFSVYISCLISVVYLNVKYMNN